MTAPSNAERVLRLWLAAALAVLLLSACSAREIYDSSAGWRRNECSKIGDQDKRERCLKEEAGRSYDDYRTGTDQQVSR